MSREMLKSNMYVLQTRPPHQSSSGVVEMLNAHFKTYIRANFPQMCKKIKWGEISLAPRCRQSVSPEAPSENRPASGQTGIRTLRPAYGSRSFSPSSYSIPLTTFHSATLDMNVLLGSDISGDTK